MNDSQLLRSVTALFRENHEHVKPTTLLCGVTNVPGADVGGLSDTRRIGIIVVNEESGREEGSVFQIKYSDLLVGSLEIELNIPILEDSIITIGQANSNNFQDRAGDVSREMAPVPKREMQFTFERGGQTIAIISPDLDIIKSISTEARRLRSIAEEHRFNENGSHSWLRPYNLSGSANLLVHYEQYLRDAYPPPRLSAAIAGQSRDESADAETIRDEWIRSQIYAHFGEYATIKSISIRVGTFNVNGREPSGDLTSWIGCNDNIRGPEQLPDVFVFGFQELDLSTEALLYSTSTLKEEKWCKAVLDNLGQYAESYVKLISKQLVGMLLFVLVRKSLRHHLSEVSSASSGQGAMWLGNKGGVALRLRIYDTVFVFVNSHLAAFDNMVDRRNADYSELRRLLRFPLPPVSFLESLPYNMYGGIFDADFTFWMGDQNYRVDLPDSDIRELLPSALFNKEFVNILEFDQLLLQRRLGRCFTELEEGRISFSPTYRYEVGNPDPFAYDAKRRPAWTDRVFHRAASHLSIEQLSYESYPDILLSDHKPVAADYLVETRQLELGKLLQILDSLFLITEDLFEDRLNRPTVTLSTKELDFGKVFYESEEIREIGVENTGKTCAFYRFVPPSGRSTLSPSWLVISPEYGVILPGESIIIRFRMLIDGGSAIDLNRGSRELSDTLILHVGGGQDHFIPVYGQYQRTCFANDLGWLSRLPSAIRDVDVKSTQGRHEEGAPREVVRILEWLMQNATGEGKNTLFVAEGNMETVRMIRDCLDTGEPFPQKPDDLSWSMARTLLEFMRSLPEPVIHWSFHSECSNVTDKISAFEVIEKLSRAAASVWLSVISYLSFISQDDENHATRLADIFGPVLLRNDPRGSPLTWISPLAKRRFILYFMS